MFFSFWENRGWSIYSGNGGHISPESGGQFKRIFHIGCKTFVNSINLCFKIMHNGYL